MKKFTLVALAMMASASCFAQTTLWDGEDKSIGDKLQATGFWDRCNPEVVANPLKDGINKTDKCVKFTITGNDWSNGDIVLPISGGLDMSTNKRLSIMIKKPLWSNVRIELSDGKTYWRQIAAYYSIENEDNWQKLVFDFSDYGDDLNAKNPTELAIYPRFEGGQVGSHEIYVDNIVLEANPMVNGSSLWDYQDKSLDGNLNLTGSYFKTTYFIVDPWTRKEIDDFAELNKKLSDGVTSIDIRDASTIGVDINKFFDGKNPNTIVYANEYYDRGNNNYANIVVGADGVGTAKSLELTDAYAFNAPHEFKAKSVKLTRSVQKGINSFVLPFAVTADELGATQVANYKGYTPGEVANFETTESVDANTPFLTTGAKEASELNFTNKDIVATPTNLGTDFVGVYAPQSAKDKYGIDDNGLLHKGGTNATIAAFHAYLNVTNGTEPTRVAFNGSTPTAINGVAADKVADTAVYDLSGRRVYGKLQKGLYIMNGKKVVVK